MDAVIPSASGSVIKARLSMSHTSQAKDGMKAGRGTVAEQRPDLAIAEWAQRIPLEEIPRLLAFLTTRLLAEGSSNRKDDCATERQAQKLLNASELAHHLELPESWVRTEERLGRIPSVRLGKYVRFRLSDVEQSLVADQRRRR